MSWSLGVLEPRTNTQTDVRPVRAQETIDRIGVSGQSVKMVQMIGGASHLGGKVTADVSSSERS